MKSKSATLEDVARHAGVSYQTVSRVLNKSANVSKATRSKVEKSIEELRYVPNRLAQQLVGKQSRTVGLVTISLALHAPSQVAAAVKRYANVEGYQVLISMIDESVNQSIQDSINELKSQLVDKVIINVPLETEQAQKIAVDNDDIVCLFLDVDPYSSVFNVSFNPADGTRASVKYLYEMGHREIAFITGSLDSPTGVERLSGYKDALARHGIALNNDLIVEGRWTPETGAAGVETLRQRRVGYSALVASNDDMAVGAMKHLHQIGVKVPEQVSVVGFDDIVLAPYIVPALSSVKVPVTEMIKESINRLIFMLDGGDFKFQQLFPGELIERDSLVPGPHA